LTYKTSKKLIFFTRLRKLALAIIIPSKFDLEEEEEKEEI